MPPGRGTKTRARAVGPGGGGGAGGGGRDASIGRRAGRNTTHQAKAHGRGNSLEPASGVMMEPDGTGIAEIEEMDGFHQPTALFDKGELLGELAELQAEAVPDTRAQIEVEEGPRGCRLIVVAGPDLGMEWAFKQAEVTIGRAGDNEIDFSDIAVSRNHARISREGNSFYLTDLGSDNGTLLNGVRIEHEALSSGDEIIIGARTLRFVELTEAPPTGAAHPVVEPEVGEPVLLSEAKIAAMEAKKLGQSQIDVGVLEQEDGEPSKDEDAEPPEPGAGSAGGSRRLGLLAVGALAVVGGLGFLGYEVYRRVDAEREREIEVRVRTEFLQAVEMVRVRRFGDALVLLDAALLARPEHARAKDYRDHAEREVEVWNVLEAARRLVAERRWDEAMSKLEPLARGNEGGSTELVETAWAPEIAELINKCKKAIAEAQVEEARTAFEADERELAMDLLMRAMGDYPGLESAQALRDRIEAAKKPVVKVVEAQKPRTPPELERAVALYKADRVPAAIDAAEAAGGPSAVKYIERMRDMMRLMENLGAAHRQKAAADVVRLAPKALEIDGTIGLGEGEIRARIKEYYADALYLKGLEAYQDGDFGKSFQLLNQALRTAPGHRLSENRISDLQGKARELYYQGYALKESNPAETRRIFRQIQQMTRASNQFHQWSAKWLSGNGG